MPYMDCRIHKLEDNHYLKFDIVADGDVIHTESRHFEASHVDFALDTNLGIASHAMKHGIDTVIIRGPKSLFPDDIAVSGKVYETHQLCVLARCRYTGIEYLMAWLPEKAPPKHLLDKWLCMSNGLKTLQTEWSETDILRSTDD